MIKNIKYSVSPISIFSLAVLSIFTFACGSEKCSQELKSGSIYTDSRLDLSEIIELRGRLIDEEVDKLSDIPRFDSNRHLLQVRIYKSYRDSKNDQLIVWEKSEAGWSAKEIRYAVSYRDPYYDSVFIDINSIATLTPRIEWQTLHDSLQRWNFYNLPGDSILAGYAFPMDGDGIGVTYDDRINHNRFRYRNIDLNRSRFKEVEAFQKMLDFIDSSFDKKYIYRSCSSPEEKKMD